MNKNRLFTPQEQERLDVRTRDMSQAFIWHEQVPVKEKVSKIVFTFSLVGLPLLIAICIASYALAFIAEEKSSFTVVVCVGIVAFVLEALVFLGWFVISDEKRKSMPPVFLFYKEKLFYIQNDEQDAKIKIPNIPSYELSALRQENRTITQGMTNSAIESECFFIEVVKGIDLGNEEDGLTVTIIEDIVDIDVDEQDDAKFIITYENEYDDEVELALDMAKWSELYNWLYAQMFS